MEDVLVLEDVKAWMLQELPRWIATYPGRRPLTMPEELPGELVAPRRKMSYAEFLDWCDEDTLAEWVNGEVVVYSPASRQHQNIAGFLASVLHSFVGLRGLGTVLSAPFQMKLEHGREPDLLFVAKEHLGRLKTTHLEGPADVVVEIISQESAGRDRGPKFLEYEAGGVWEYWLIDPLRRWAEFYRLGEAGRYETVFAGRDGVFHSQVISGFWLRAEWLWLEPLPEVDEVLLEIEAEGRAQRWLALLTHRWGREQVQRWLEQDPPQGG